MEVRSCLDGPIHAWKHWTEICTAKMITLDNLIDEPHKILWWIAVHVSRNYIKDIICITGNEF